VEQVIGLQKGTTVSVDDSKMESWEKRKSVGTCGLVKRLWFCLEYTNMVRDLVKVDVGAQKTKLPNPKNDGWNKGATSRCPSASSYPMPLFLTPFPRNLK
jgi:hypothetical protein